jgi:hypothetical protein
VTHVVHGKPAVAAMQYFADFFVEEARKCPHTWIASEQASPLIYSFNPVDVTEVSTSKWNQVYFF